MMDKLIKMGINCIIVLTIYLFGSWITNGDFQNMVIFLLSGIMTNQFIILDRFDEGDNWGD